MQKIAWVIVKIDYWTEVFQDLWDRLVVWAEKKQDQ